MKNSVPINQSIWLYSFSKMQVSIEKKITWKNKQINQNALDPMKWTCMCSLPWVLLFFKFAEKTMLLPFLLPLYQSLPLDISLLLSLYQCLFLSFYITKSPYLTSHLIQYIIYYSWFFPVPFKATSLHGFLSLKEELIFIRGGKGRENMKYICNRKFPFGGWYIV